MSYGIIIRNNSNEVVIDGVHPLLNLIAVTEQHIAGGKVTGPAEREDHLRENIVRIPHYGAQDAVPFFCPSYGMDFGVTGMKRTSSHLEIGVVAWTGGALRVELYSYADFAISTQGDYGLQVFDAGGSLIFDSRNPPLKPRDFQQGNFNIPLAGRAGQPYGISGDTLLKYVDVIIDDFQSGQYHPYYEYKATAFLSWQNDRLILDAPQYENMNQYELRERYTFNYGEGMWADPPGDYIGPGCTYPWHVINGGAATLGTTICDSYDGFDF